MRTTILLPDDLAENLKLAARKRGVSFSAFLAEAGRAALKATQSVEERPFQLITYGEQGAYPGINLDKSSQLLASEDETNYGS